jgi:hypothetical protein
MEVATLIEASDCRHRVEAGLDPVRVRHGAWTALNVALPCGSFTIAPDASTSDIQRGDYFVGVVTSVLRRSLGGLTILDLRC